MQQGRLDVVDFSRPSYGLAGLRMLTMLLVGVLGTGCHVLVSNEAEWSKPIVVPKSPDILEGAKVSLHCGRGDFEGDYWRPSRVSGCKHLAKILVNLGATIVAGSAGAKSNSLEDTKDGEQTKNVATTRRAATDFQVVYIDRSYRRDACGWTIVPFLLTFTFFPCVEDIVSRAELRFLDSSGVVMEEQKLHVDLTAIYGPAALYYMLLELIERPEPPEVVVERRQTHFVEFIKSRIISHWTRRQVEIRANQGAAS